MLPTAGQWINSLTAYEGTQEHPRGSNDQIFAAMAGHVNGQPWCATFGVGVEKSKGFDCLPSDSAYCPSVLDAYIKTSRMGYSPRVGAQFFIWFQSMHGVHHTGWVTAYDANYVWTIEGNTNDNGSREGYEVARRKRPRSSIYAYGYPRFATPVKRQPTLSRYLQKGSTGYAVTNLQKLLKVTADGQFGPNTEAALKKWQKAHGLRPDGVVGPSTAAKLGWRWIGR